MNEPKTRDLTSKQGMLEFIPDIIEMLTDEFTEEGGILTKALIITYRNPETNEDMPTPGLVYIPPPKEFEEPDKELYADTIRRVAKSLFAVGVIFISEAWLVQGEKNWKKWAGNLRNHPDRKEKVFFTIEHREVGQLLYSAEIFRPEGGKPYLGEFEEFKSDGPGPVGASGKFTYLIPEVS